MLIFEDKYKFKAVKLVTNYIIKQFCCESKENVCTLILYPALYDSPFWILNCHTSKFNIKFVFNGTI